MAEVQKKIDLLKKIAHCFNEAGITWALGASMLLYFKGVVPDFHDIDHPIKSWVSSVCLFPSTSPTTRISPRFRTKDKSLIFGIPAASKYQSFSASSTTSPISPSPLFWMSCTSFFPTIARAISTSPTSPRIHPDCTTHPFRITVMRSATRMTSRSL